MYVKCIVYGSRYFGSMQMYIIITWTRLSYIVISWQQFEYISRYTDTSSEKVYKFIFAL